MTRFFSSLALAAFLFTGCDAVESAPASAASWDDYGECSRAFTIFGPSTVSPGATQDYVANTDPDCALYIVDWTVTSGNATIVGQGGQYGAGEVVTVQAPSSGSFTLRAIVESSAGVSGRNKTVSVN